MGRQWVSSADQSLCFSLGFVLDCRPPSWLSIVAGVEVLACLHDLGAGSVGLKWPNDLMLGTRKLGGILCESGAGAAAKHFVVVGVGLNLQAPGTQVASSLNQAPAGLNETGYKPGAIPAPQLALQFARQIHGGLQMALLIGPQSHFTSFRKHDVFNGQQIILVSSGEEFARGKACSISEDGSYLIETPSGLKTFQSGEVSLRGQHV